MNKLSTSLVALLAVFGTAGMGLASESSEFAASVSVLSPDATGFIIGGQTSVNGLGSSSVVLTRSDADLSVMGNASSKLSYNTSSLLYGVTSVADIESAFDFDRQIDTAGSLVGQGAVVARGEAIGSIGTAGAASANTATAGAGTDLTDVGSASADASSMGSLNGSVSTANTLQLLGTNGLFAGSNSLSVGEENQAIAYGAATIVADGATGISLNSASAPFTLGTLTTATGNGALFAVQSNLSSFVTGTSGTTGITMAVSNAGNGTISLTTSTGGFFTGGGFAEGAATHIDGGSFFAAP